MADEAGFLIHPDSAKKLGALFRGMDQNPLSPANFEGGGYGRTTSVLQFVTITGAAISAGLYPGTVSSYDNTAGSFPAGTVCRIRSADGNDLTTGTYAAKLVGADIVSGDQVPVFMVSPGPWLTLSVVTDVYCNAGVLTVTKQTIKIPGGRLG